MFVSLHLPAPWWAQIQQECATHAHWRMRGAEAMLLHQIRLGQYGDLAPGTPLELTRDGDGSLAIAVATTTGAPPRAPCRGPW